MSAAFPRKILRIVVGRPRGQRWPFVGTTPMTQFHKVDLRYFKTVEDSVVLTYRQVTLDRSQTRLLGREVLIPDISLSDYTCNAVIDWITVDLQLQRVTQQQWLADAFAGFGRRPYIEPIDPGAGKESSHFTVKVQEPDIAELRRILAALGRKYGLVSEPVVIAMEVSVDFTPRTPSDEARARMVGVLSRQLAAPLSVFSSQDAMPRIVWGTKHRWARIQEPGRGSYRDPYRFAVNDVTNTPGADTTTYFGAEESDDMVRVMDKVRDRQNTFSGTYEVLPPDKQRCRVEVTLKQGKLASLGISHIEDVSRFQFATLQGLYFQFKLATTQPQSHSAGPGHAYLERQRIQKFLMTGISGLAKMDHTRLELDRTTRPVFRKALKSRGRTLAGRPRTGTGPYGTAVAYEQLCKIVQTALANLSRKLRQQDLM